MRASQPRTMVVAQARSPAITAEGPAQEGSDATTPMGGGLALGLAGGLIGGLVVVDRDQRANRRRAGWMKRCEIDDPVEEIRDDFAETLAAMLSVEVLETDRRTKATTPEDVIKDHQGADLILDIRTSKWGVHRVAAESRRAVHFAAGYEGTLRLIDARRRAVVAEATCAIQFSNDDDPPTLNELFEDDCALLKKGLTLSAQTCARRFRTRALGLD